MNKLNKEKEQSNPTVEDLQVNKLFKRFKKYEGIRDNRYVQMYIGR